MVKISGTLSSNVTLSSKMTREQPHALQTEVQPVEKPDKPVLRDDQRPDMTFSGIGRQIDIRV
ncbi:MAG: hypothetical protein ABJN40_21640 [Sneathiella sp.]